MKIKVRYLDKTLEEKLEICFEGFDWIGVWICNNYQDVEIIEIIQEE